MKRTLFNITRTITSLVVLLMTLPVWGNDGDTFTEKTVEGVNLTYTIISEAEKTCMVGEKYNWPIPTARANRVHRVSGSHLSGDITIPEVANGYAVVRIEAYAFEQAAITSVVIPNSVKAVGIGAFNGCADLESVRLSNKLSKIEGETFFNCTNLTSIDIPEGVTSIGDDAFYGCRQLKEATIPSSVVNFGEYVFCSTGFTSMPKLPEGLTTIPYGIFQSCPLTSVEIPQNITTIDGCAFNNCLFTEIEIPASVTHIGVAAFARCKNLSSIVIPNNVTDIDFNAFKECSNLRTVILSNKITSLSKGIFSECSNLESVIVPNGVKSIGKSAFEGCSSLRSINIPEGVEEIAPRTFFGCSSLKQLIIPNSILRIINEDEDGNHKTFVYGCNSLTSIIVDKANPVFDSRDNCNAIIETASNTLIAGCTATKIPEGIISIGSYAFAGLENLTTMTLPRSLKRIEGGAFNMSGLQEIDIPENVTFIGSYSICNCKQLKTVRSFVCEPFEISENAFSGSTSAAILYVPKGTIEKYKSAKGWMVFKEIVEMAVQDDYRPFVEEGKVWTYHYYNDMTGKDFYESLMVSGDTVVDDKSYKKIVDVTTGRVDCAIREEGRKVYATYPHYSGEKLIYDFGLNVGDAFLLYDDNNGSDPNAWATVVSVDTIVVGSRAFRALDVRSNDMKGWPNWWVEGIGGKYGLTENCLLPGNSYCFSSCKLGEDTLFTNHDFQTLGTIPSIETQTAYYYYKGGKIPLTQNENKVVVSIPKEYDGVCKRIRANLPVLSTIKDQVFDSFIIPRSDFERLTSQDFWEEDAKSVVLTSSYYTEEKMEVFETPYLNVKLKKEEDASLLASYAEKYRLKIVGKDSFMPLWYILHVTPESEKSPLKCANELFESGEFASAVPDLSSDDDFEIGVAYRPFIEDGKVWKVGTISGNPVQVVDYYYFDGDTIVGEKTCKQMMCQRYVAPDFSDDFWTPTPSLTKVGAWYEEDKKVYFYDEEKQSMRMMYDFSLETNDTLQFLKTDGYPPLVIGPRQIGDLKGFKGVYRDIMLVTDVGTRILSTPWLEGVGNIECPTRNANYFEKVEHVEFLMSCTVGDEVIYLNDEYEDGATPEALARKDRIDFTHTIKIKPKSRTAREAEAKSLYGEYNSQQLGINFNALDEAYQVSITDETGKVVYEKTVNAGSIVGLNIDISAYAKGRYTVTVENSNESFTGQFETQTTGISLTPALSRREGAIYNLQGQRINSLRKGLNIVNGRKVYKY